MRQEVPSRIYPPVEILDKITDVLCAVGIQISQALQGVGIEAVVIAIEKVEGHKRVKSLPLRAPAVPAYE